MIEHRHEVISIGVECGGQSASFERMSYSVYMLDGETYIASEHANAGNMTPNDEEHERTCERTLSDYY